MAAMTLRRPPLLVDRELLRAADLRVGPGAEAVAGFLAERGLEPHRVEPAQAHYRPGRWLAVCFRTASVERASGRPVCLTVTAEHRAGADDAIWSFPDDPNLPGLAAAVDRRTLRRRLPTGPGEIEVEPLRYRPRRRAVVRYRVSGGRTLFGKVVPPARSRRLLALAEALGGEPIEAGLHLTLPIGRVGRGALVLPCATGHPLRELLLRGATVPAPERLARLPADIDRRCQAALAVSAAAGLPARRRSFEPAVALTAAQTVARLVPTEAYAAARLTEAVISWAEASEPPEWAVHGDLYENQIHVDGDRIILIDLDDLGPGDPLLDAANFCAHLRLLAASDSPVAGAIDSYREEVQTAFCRSLDAGPAELAWREAYCLLRLAPGPFRVLHPDWQRRVATRLALAAEALTVRRVGPVRCR